MAYQSKTYCLSEKVIAEIKRRVDEAKKSDSKASPNKVLTDLFWPAPRKVRQNG